MKNNKTEEIYIHIPFCARKCDYCDFVSFVTDSDTRKRYFDMLIKEIEFKAESTGKFPVDSVFFGGGTPSMADKQDIARVLETIRKHYKFTDEPEITIEMNPNSASGDKLRAYKAMGINRVSIGLQSADDNELKALSRLHNYEEFLKTYDQARRAGFDNINVDLMSAIPGQTVASFERTLSRVISLNPEHISAYSLILEEGTPFYERYFDGQGLPDEDTDREMYKLAGTLLQKAGYNRYEISNYSKPGFECRHNTGYWRRVPYTGFGLSAASLYDEIRYAKHSNLKAYLEGDFSEEKTVLLPKDIMEEFMFLGLRMTSGVSKEEFKDSFGLSVYDEYGKQINKLNKEGLMIDSGDRLYLNEKGLDVANYCMSEFIH